MARVLLLDGDSDSLELTAGTAGRYRAFISLFWLAPSTRAKIEERGGATCYTLEDVIGSELEWGREADRLAREVVTRGPRYRSDLSWRTYLAEQLYRELLPVVLLVRLAEFAVELESRLGASELVLEGHLATDARQILERTVAPYPGISYLDQTSETAGPITAGPRPVSLPGRLLKRYREVRVIGGLKHQVALLAEQLDPVCRFRSRWGKLLFRNAPPRHGIAFLSSYKNNTESLRPFLEQMPGPVHWVLVNYSALRGLSDTDERYWLWAFGDGSRTATIDRADQPGDDEPPGYRAWRRSSATIGHWLSTGQRFLQALTHCWESYLTRAEPRLVVTANQLGIEGWLAAVARRRGIPVLQVMHGILGGYFYTRTPIETDAMVTYGEFWRRLWPERETAKITAYNPGGQILSVPRRAHSGPRRLTFFSWRLEGLAGYGASEFRSGYLGIFHRLLQRGDTTLTIRAHPQENPHDFLSHWNRRFGPPPPEIRFSKHEPLEQVLAETDVALMYRSTVMLHCLASEIPVVMPGWIDFVWNRELEGVDGLCLADDFADLEETLASWLADPPAVDPEWLRSFLRPPGEGRDAFARGVSALMREPSP